MARLEEFDDVQLDVEFTQAGTRSNITSNENIAISFGKIAKWYEALVPTGGSSGQFLGFNSSGTAKWVSNPNVDEKVKATKLAQSTADASYYPTLVAGEGTAGVSIFDSAKINHTKGTTSAVGNTRLILGNATNEGTTNNEEGLLRIYSPGTKYHTLKGAKITTDNVDHTLPTTGGTILNTGTTSFTQTLSSGTKIGTIKINGTSSDIYAPTDTDTKVTDTVGTANTYYPAGGTSTSTATGTQVFDTSLKFIGTTGSTSAVGKAQLVLGNATASGTANNKQGSIVVYGSTAYAHTIQGAPTAARTLTLPDKTGTFALTSDIPSVPTVNDAALTLKGAGTTVTTFTANASSAKSLDIVAGSNVTVTADATNAKISIAASHPTITKSTDTTSTASPAHGGTFTVVDSITREANGHVTKINTKTVTLPADSNTDTKVTQSQTTTTNYRPILFGAKDSTDISTLANTVTDQAYTSTKMFAKPDTGNLYASGFSTSSYINGTGAQLNQYGLYLKSYKSASLPAGGNYSYAEYAIRVYDGKATDNNGMLLTIDGGGLTIVGGGESAKSLAALISDDQRDSNTSRTRLNVGGTLNTAYHGSEEQLILSSDNNIYFLTTCQTIANRKPVVLDVNSYFYPGTTKTGSIGTSSYMWNSVYAATIYENGTSLASKYAAIGHTHTTTIAADSGTNQLTLAASTKYKLTTGGTNFIFTTPPNTTYSAGTGLSLSGTTFNHSNSVTAVTSAVFKKITYDAQGHITGTANVTASDIPSHTHSYLPLSGTTINNPNTSSVSFTNGMTGNILFANTGNTNGVARGIGGIVGTTDSWSVRGYQTGENKGCLEISVGDDGDEGIYVRQYTSGAYKATFSNNAGSASGLTYRELVLMAPSTGASTFPSDVTLSGGRLYLSGSPGNYGQLNLKSASYNVMFRNDNANTYILLTAQGDPDGAWTSSRPLTINNSTGICSINGNAANVTGTVAIAHGGTGATNRLAALRALTEENVGTSAQYFLTITDSWGKGGYTTVADAKTVLGLKSAAYTASTDYLSSSTKYAGSSSAGGAATSANILNKNNAAGATTAGVQYANGPLTVGTADGNAVEGSNGSYKLWSYPAGGTAVGGGTANIQNLRLYWSSTWFRDIFISPNNYDIYHRSVAAGTAQPWRKVLDSGNYTSYTLPRNIKHIHTASGTEGSAGWVKIARITVTADYPNHPMTFTIAQRGVMQYRIHLVLKNYRVASAAISEFIIARDNSWTDTNNNPRAYIIKPSDGIFDLYIRKIEAWDHIFVVDFTKADGSEGDNYSVTWTNVHAADSEITGGTEAVKKLYLLTTTNYAGSSSVGGAATSANKLNTNAGATNRPVYFSGGVPVQCDAPESKTWFKGVPSIGTNGVMEVGRYFDMHSTNTGTSDYDVRLDASGVSSFRFTFNTPASSSIAPSTNNQTSLGTSSLKWSNVYATTFYGALSGNASTATKLETARNIALAEDFAGSANFDGSGNISISGTFYRCSASSNNTANYPWHRIAYRTGVTGSYNDTDAIFMIRACYNSGPFGIIKVAMRTNGPGTNCQVAARWLVRQNIAADDVYIAQWGKTGQSVYADIFLKGTTYNRAYVYQIAGSRWWTLVNSAEAIDTTTSDKKTSTEVYASIAAAGTTLHNQAYTQTVAGIDEGHVNSANSAAYATRANYLDVVAGNEVRFYNNNQFKEARHFWLGYSWADGSHYTPSGGSDTSSTTAPNITKFVMGDCSGGGLTSVHAKTFILGNGSSPTFSSKTTTITTAATTTDRTITLPDDSGTVALTSKTFNVTRGSSKSTATTGYWAAMCNSTQAGSPTLPTAVKWWHVISMDWTNNDTNNWISQLAIATQDGSGVWWRRNNASGTSIDSSSWHRLAEGNSSGAATNIATEVESSAGARPVFYAYLGDNTRVVYNTNFTYNPSGNVLKATTFDGEITTLAFHNRIYALSQTPSGSTWNGNETLITSIPSSSGTSTPSYQRVKTIDFVKDCISGLKEPVLYENTTNPSTSTTIQLPNGIPKYLKVFIGVEYSSDGSTYSDSAACINCIDVDMAHTHHGGFIGYDTPGQSGVGNYLAYCYVNVKQNTGSTTAYTVGISYAKFLNLATSATVQNIIARIVKIIAVY